MTNLNWSFQEFALKTIIFTKTKAKIRENLIDDFFLSNFQSSFLENNVRSMNLVSSKQASLETSSIIWQFSCKVFFQTNILNTFSRSLHLCEF